MSTPNGSQWKNFLEVVMHIGCGGGSLGALWMLSLWLGLAQRR